MLTDKRVHDAVYRLGEAIWAKYTCRVTNSSAQSANRWHWWPHASMKFVPSACDGPRSAHKLVHGLEASTERHVLHVLVLYAQVLRTVRRACVCLGSEKHVLSDKALICAFTLSSLTRTFFSVRRSTEDEANARTAPCMANHCFKANVNTRESFNAALESIAHILLPAKTCDTLRTAEWDWLLAKPALLANRQRTTGNGRPHTAHFPHPRDLTLRMRSAHFFLDQDKPRRKQTRNVRVRI